ncbi:MAG TPA: 23S rRNA (adenine(2503)-C(2))-methyltransferase RlmN [Kiritimatiellia bacterium]|mgnify:CR=1 FL=1|nr:23S rRNA (adenine(2503)-C(2))-methyltransferase RlmN [Kiritimatiellia bacterium]
MTSVYELDALEAACRRLRLSEAAAKRFRIGWFKKGRSPDDCLAAFDPESRKRFTVQVRLHALEVAQRHDSSRDGATKLLFRAEDGARVEAVILRVASGRTSLCISSQVGCGADCAFCATGKLGLARNLTAHEILDQVVLASRVAAAEGRSIRNVVFMGMGEPFHNEAAVCEALEVLRAGRGFALSERHLLVSTVGEHRAMRRFVQRFPRMRIALSLHSARQEVRERIMPTAGFHSLEKIRAVLPEVAQHGNLMIEVLLLEGINDGPEDVQALIDYLDGLSVHVNLIQFNPFPGAGFRPVTKEARESFGAALRRAGFTCTLRYSLGDDIAAACGQLAG